MKYIRNSESSTQLKSRRVEESRGKSRKPTNIATDSHRQANPRSEKVATGKTEKSNSNSKTLVIFKIFQGKKGKVLTNSES